MQLPNFYVWKTLPITAAQLFHGHILTIVMTLAVDSNTTPWSQARSQALHCGFCLSLREIFSKALRQNSEWKVWVWGYHTKQSKLFICQYMSTHFQLGTKNVMFRMPLRLLHVLGLVGCSHLFKDHKHCGLLTNHCLNSTHHLKRTRSQDVCWFVGNCN